MAIDPNPDTFEQHVLKVTRLVNAQYRQSPSAKILITDSNEVGTVYLSLHRCQAKNLVSACFYGIIYTLLTV